MARNQAGPKRSTEETPLEGYVTANGTRTLYAKEGDQGEVVLLVYGISTLSFLRIRQRGSPISLHNFISG